MLLHVIPLPRSGAEDVLVGLDGDEGAVFTGTEDGSILRLSEDGDRVERVADTGGRPLGLEALPDGRLLVCDARQGLLAVDPRCGHVELLASEAGGRRMRFCNNAAVAADGTVYFSDSSAVHGIDEWKADMVEQTRTGRLLRRTPDGMVSVVADGFAFANGVTLAPDESFVLVAETATCTVARCWLSGPRQGTRDVFAEDLPGYPDNIALGSDGLIWVTIASPRDRLVDWIQRQPLPLRRAVSRMPDFAQPSPRRTVHVRAYDSTGRLVHDLDLDGSVTQDKFHMATGVREHRGRVWLGSLHEPAVAVLTL